MTAGITTGKNSCQNYGTPWELFNAIKKHFDITHDLAADRGNHKRDIWYGPGGVSEDALNTPWLPTLDGSWYWLNPPWNDIPTWYKLCAKYAKGGARIISLVPMDAAARWFKYVPGNAGIWHLQGRVKFDGADNTYSKDCALHIWDPWWEGTFKVWNWRRDEFLI